MQLVKQSKIDIIEIVEELKQGKVIVYPTETCYGLGCDATNQEAVDRLFKIKQRQRDKTVLVLVSGLDMAERYIELSPKILDLAQKYWPGPLTVVAPVLKSENLATGVIAGDNTMAIRVTDHHFAKQLCESLDAPIVSTSANISALESPYDIESVLEMYRDAEDKPDIIIDGGALPHKSPSTIVKVVDDEVEVLRQGEIIIKT